MKLSKTLLIIFILIFISIPIYYLILNGESNIIFDFIWIIIFAQLTKEFILKIVFKKKYCDIKTSSKNQSR